MILIELTNIKNLNTSIQIGDAIYVTPSSLLLNNSNRRAGSTLNADDMVGFLRKIDNIGNNYTLHVDDTGYSAVVLGLPNPSFIMFSKYNQSDDDIKGYYMEVEFVNNSKEKAELFSVSSEVTESSK